MPSASMSGLEARVRISTDGGSNFTTWTEKRAVTLSLTAVTADVTNSGTSTDGSGIPWTENKAIRREWSASVDANLVDDAMNDTLNTYAMNLSALYFEFAPDVGTGIPKFTGYGIVSVQDSSPNNDITVRSITIQAAGPLAVANQS
jgi:predicted secreted protein